MLQKFNKSIINYVNAVTVTKIDKKPYKQLYLSIDRVVFQGYNVSMCLLGTYYVIKHRKEEKL